MATRRGFPGTAFWLSRPVGVGDFRPRRANSGGAPGTSAARPAGAGFVSFSLPHPPIIFTGQVLIAGRQHTV